MKILKPGNIYSELSGRKQHPFTRPRRGKPKKTEFKKIFEKSLTGEYEDSEEFRLLLPTQGLFWDNGYEDLMKEVL